MGRPVTANVPHKLGKAEAMRRIDVGFAAVQQSMTVGFAMLVSFQQRWEGDRLHFEGSGLGQKITGRLDVLDDSVQILVDLPELLVAIAERLKANLTTRTAKLLQDKN